MRRKNRAQRVKGRSCHLLPLPPHRPATLTVGNKWVNSVFIWRVSGMIIGTGLETWGMTLFSKWLPD